MEGHSLSEKAAPPIFIIQQKHFKNIQHYET